MLLHDRHAADCRRAGHGKLHEFAITALADILEIENRRCLRHRFSKPFQIGEVVRGYGIGLRDDGENAPVQ